MRLVVISHTPHVRQSDGGVAGWSATVRELDAIASTVDELVHVAPLHDHEPPLPLLRYEAANVRVAPVEPGGGTSVLAKLGVATRVPSWARVIRRELVGADAVHVRLPANISAVALLQLMARRRPARRWFKYAGAWNDRRNVPLSYRLQRWSLRELPRLHRGVVTINGSTAPEPEHVRVLRNPSLTDDELDQGRRSAAQTVLSPISLLFAGRLEPGKGPMIAVATGLRLVQLGHDVRLDVAGDGPLREEVVAAGAKNERLQVHVHGWLDRDRLNQLYAHAHFVLLPSATEGFPKVLAEGMAFGAVPVASDVGSVAQVFAEVDAGFVVTDNDAQTFAAVIDDIVSAPGRWQEASNRARAAAPSFTYARHVQAVVDLLGDRDGVDS